MNIKSTCTTCHPAGGPPPLTAYGTSFSTVPAFKSNPTEALCSIGAPSGSTINNCPAVATTTSVSTGTTTATSQITPGTTNEVSDEGEDHEGTETGEETDDDAKSAVTTGKLEDTQTTPGFGIVAAIAGLFMLFILVKRNNK
ncbi:MAG: PGF-CTERM sorting domain-containing protein [Candidatus Methanoperedens sp.]|nr:PGF-CTERM sorting domain-containing protein [Candidatus Methanoperedens sp.]